MRYVLTRDMTALSYNHDICLCRVSQVKLVSEVHKVHKVQSAHVVTAGLTDSTEAMASKASKVHREATLQASLIAEVRVLKSGRVVGPAVRELGTRRMYIPFIVTVLLSRVNFPFRIQYTIAELTKVHYDPHRRSGSFESSMERYVV